MNEGSGAIEAEIHVEESAERISLSNSSRHLSALLVAPPPEMSRILEQAHYGSSSVIVNGEFHEGFYRAGCKQALSGEPPSSKLPYDQFVLFPTSTLNSAIDRFSTSEFQEGHSVTAYSADIVMQQEIKFEAEPVITDWDAPSQQWLRLLPLHNPIWSKNPGRTSSGFRSILNTKNKLLKLICISHALIAISVGDSLFIEII